MVNKQIVLLTGACGFIGSQIARRLLFKSDINIIALVHAKDDIEAKSKLSKAWWDWTELHDSICVITKPLAGDIRKKNLGLSEQCYNDLVGKVNLIIHCAAKWRFDTPKEELFQTNVQGTANLLDLAKAANENHRIFRFSYISTAYVSGKLQGKISEDTLTDKYGFITDYEQSKFEGEKLVQLAKNDLPISVFRPTMVIGDSDSGEIKTFNTIYAILRLYMLRRVRFLPMNSRTKINIVPVNYVADKIVELSFNDLAIGLTFHINSRYEDLPTAHELTDLVRKWAYEKLKIRLPNIRFFPLPDWMQRSVFRVWGGITGNSKYSRLMGVFSYYFKSNQVFLRNNLEKLTNSYKFNLEKVISPILDYAVYYGFLHRSGRTVHEQILFRLEGKKMPVCLFDVIEGKIVQKNNEEIKSEIFSICAALSFMGIRKGDRVALVGLNSVRYLALDVAIGLVGAISVPLYYTSAPVEIEKIVKASKSKILFIGAPQILNRISELNLEIPTVNFSAKSNVKKENLVSWKEFISVDQKKVQYLLPSIFFSDLCTIRYTSGSTGENKGACFSHANIVWLAETVSSLFSWKARTNEVRYLSYLPLNHVVEGILGLYSSFYEPSQLKLYFLENFYDLQKTLAKVKPVVFFSIPRFYEKVWDSLKRTRIGQSYLSSKNKIKRRFLRHFVKRGLLRKAGLDYCAQLIVGSAPSNRKLLFSFRDLGIEVHDAYGLTEAPLVTINRLGRNHIGSVGQPLPKTKLKIADDGELLVKGPQVMQGYHNEEKTNGFVKGWLATGDLGKVDNNGNLVIYGRKKEVIATSYGKMISPFKIESMLKGLEVVDEVLLIGEEKPFVSALIWSAQSEKNLDKIKLIEKGIVEINNNLSRAEKVRVWVVLRNDLSVEKGDLTANFKLKRYNIYSRFSRIIDSLYSSQDISDIRILSFGRSKID